MKKNIIKMLINIWDPLGVYGEAPEDEYDDLVTKLIDLFDNSASDKKIKDYLLNQYYSSRAENKAKIDELYNVLCSLRNID